MKLPDPLHTPLLHFRQKHLKWFFDAQNREGLFYKTFAYLFENLKRDFFLYLVNPWHQATIKNHEEPHFDNDFERVWAQIGTISFAFCQLWSDCIFYHVGMSFNTAFFSYIPAWEAVQDWMNRLGIQDKPWLSYPVATVAFCLWWPCVIVFRALGYILDAILDTVLRVLQSLLIIMQVLSDVLLRKLLWPLALGVVGLGLVLLSTYTPWLAWSATVELAIWYGAIVCLGCAVALLCFGTDAYLSSDADSNISVATLYIEGPDHGDFSKYSPAQQANVSDFPWRRVLLMLVLCATWAVSVWVLPFAFGWVNCAVLLLFTLPQLLSMMQEAVEEDDALSYCSDGGLNDDKSIRDLYTSRKVLMPVCIMLVGVGLLGLGNALLLQQGFLVVSGVLAPYLAAGVWMMMAILSGLTLRKMNQDFKLFGWREYMLFFVTPMLLSLLVIQPQIYVLLHHVLLLEVLLPIAFFAVMVFVGHLYFHRYQINFDDGKDGHSVSVCRESRDGVNLDDSYDSDSYLSLGAQLGLSSTSGEDGSHTSADIVGSDFKIDLDV